MQAVRVYQGGELRYEKAPDPVAGPTEVVVELKAAAVNRRDLLVRNPPGPAYEFDLPLIPGSDGAGVRRDTGEEVVIYPGLHWGPREDAAGPEWQIRRRTHGHHTHLADGIGDNIVERDPAVPQERRVGEQEASRLTRMQDLLREGNR